MSATFYGEGFVWHFYNILLADIGDCIPKLVKVKDFSCSVAFVKL